MTRFSCHWLPAGTLRSLSLAGFVFGLILRAAVLQAQTLAVRYRFELPYSADTIRNHLKTLPPNDSLLQSRTFMTEMNKYLNSSLQLEVLSNDTASIFRYVAAESPAVLGAGVEMNQRGTHRITIINTIDYKKGTLHTRRESEGNIATHCFRMLHDGYTVRPGKGSRTISGFRCRPYIVSDSSGRSLKVWTTRRFGQYINPGIYFQQIPHGIVEIEWGIYKLRMLSVVKTQPLASIMAGCADASPGQTADLLQGLLLQFEKMTTGQSH